MVKAKAKQLYFDILKFKRVINGKKASIQFMDRIKYPRLVLTIDNDQKDNWFDNSIVAPLTREELISLASLIKFVSKSQDDCVYKLNCKNVIWDKEKNEPTENKYTQGIIEVGKKNGIVYLGMSAPEKGVFRFSFGTDKDWHTVTVDDNTSTDKLMSVLKSRGEASVLLNMVAILEVNDAEAYYQLKKDS